MTMPQLHRIKNIPFSLSVLELQTLTSQNSSSLSSSLLSSMRYDEFCVSICLSLPFIAFHCLSLNASESVSKHCCMLQTYRNPVYAVYTQHMQDMSPSFSPHTRPGTVLQGVQVRSRTFSRSCREALRIHISHFAHFESEPIWHKKHVPMMVTSVKIEVKVCGIGFCQSEVT